MTARADVLAYRAVLHGFGTAPPHDALLDLGVQDTPPGSAALALSARGLTERGLTTVWSFRGAPHRHRADQGGGCNAHARRKFHEAKLSDALRACQALAFRMVGGRHSRAFSRLRNGLLLSAGW